MSLRRSAPALLVCALSAAACHQSSSGGSIVLPSTSTSNLGLATGMVIGTGGLRLLAVAEAEQGQDLDGDGDLLDGVVHVLDLDLDRVLNTGLVLGIYPARGSEVPARAVAAVGDSLAFGVSESETGGLDRNDDGDAEDFVLAFYDRAGASITSLGLAVSNVVASADALAFDVPEAAQGEDLDGDGEISSSASVPFVHDLRTGETWNTGLRGAAVLAVDGDFVALAVRESAVGDLDGDGDTQDLVFELYDLVARSVQHIGLALSPGFGGLGNPPVASAGHWAVNVYEGDQGADLNDDGDLLDVMAFVYDPSTQTARDLGQYFATKRPGVEPLVLFAPPPPASMSFTPFVWLYDVRTDLLASTGLRSNDVQAVGERFVLQVPEAEQGEDLDHNGFLDSYVAVLYDLASGRTQNLGIDAAGLRAFQDDGGGLLLRARESASRRDWNRDGDRDDVVLFTWDERSGELMNTRLDPVNAAPLGQGILLLVMDEASGGRDLNGDGDRLDNVVETYDIRSRRLTNLGLAAPFLFESASNKALLPVYEVQQGVDLNGDGDQTDLVSHLTQVLFYAD